MPHTSKIELRGFKSFRDKIELPLFPGLTVIGGPNGSGKSNLVDAFCFVLGWMKTKTMRAERFSDLLFNGGDGRRSAPFAEVSLHFDNEDGSIGVDSKQVIITRRVDRSGKCVYRINRKRVNRQEIVDSLSESTLGLGEYNFVMQGDVGRFVRMDPFERRRIIDDFAGIAEYDEKKEKSLLELQRVEMNLGTMAGILEEISTQLERLRSEKEGAIRYGELKTRLELAKAALLWAESESCGRALLELRREKDEATKKLGELQKRAEKLRDEMSSLEVEERRLNDLEEKHDVHTITSAERLRERVATLREEMLSLNRKRAEIEGELRAEKVTPKGPQVPEELFSRFRRLHHEFDALSGTLIADENLTPAGMRSQLGRLKRLLGDIRSVLESIRTHLTRVLTGGDLDGGLVDRLISLRAQHEQLCRGIGELRDRIKSAQTELEKISAHEARVQKLVKRARERRKRVRARLSLLREKEARVREKSRAIEGKLGDYRVEEARLQIRLEANKKAMEKIKLGTGVQKHADPSKLSREVEAIEAELEALGPVNLRAIQDFESVKRRYDAERARYDKLISEKRAILEFMEEIDRKKIEAFMRSFKEISRNFGEIFSELSPGGSAELVLEDEANPLESGLEIEAKPAGKEILRPTAMSGGEKALTALAFIFALQRARPCSFYVFDEIDAHLDDEKLPRVARMLKRYARESQIIVVTLKDSMMSVADRVFGVTMDGNGVSNLVSLELSGFEE